MSFHRISSQRIKLEKSHISTFDLLSTNYVGFNIVKIKKSASRRKK